MKRMCAWCGRELDQVERRDSQPLTHGLCPECRRRYFAVARDQDGPLVENDEERPRRTCPSSSRE